MGNYLNVGKLVKNVVVPEKEDEVAHLLRRVQVDTITEICNKVRESYVYGECTVKFADRMNRLKHSEILKILE